MEGDLQSHISCTNYLIMCSPANIKKLPASQKLAYVVTNAFIQSKKLNRVSQQDFPKQSRTNR